MKNEQQSVRETLLETALQLFATEGYDAVGIARIVDQAGVTKPSLYHYFGSKEGLLNSILNQYVTHFLEKLEKLCKYEGDIIKTIEDLTMYYYHYSRDLPLIAAIIHSLRACPVNSEAFKCYLPFAMRENEVITQMFMDMANHHTNLKGKEQLLTRSFIGQMDCHGAYITTMMQNTPNENISIHDPLSEEFLKLAKQFMYGIFA